MRLSHLSWLIGSELTAATALYQPIAPNPWPIIIFSDPAFKPVHHKLHQEAWKGQGKRRKPQIGKVYK